MQNTSTLITKLPTPQDTLPVSLNVEIPGQLYNQLTSMIDASGQDFNAVIAQAVWMWTFVTRLRYAIAALAATAPAVFFLFYIGS